MWILGLWAGWVLVFASDPRALGLSSGPGFADWTGRIWFVSYTMFTVGNGDFTPADGAWQVVSGLVAATGMSLVTLAVTYLRACQVVCVRPCGDLQRTWGPMRSG